MPDNLSPMPNVEPTLHLEFVPMEEEEGNFDTLVKIGQVRAEIQRELKQGEDITVEYLSTDERAVDVLILIPLVGTAIVASKDLLTSFFNMITATVELLAKKDHVREIEIIADGKTIILRDINRKTAKEIVEALETQQLETSMTSIPKNVVKVKAKVSKKKRAKN